jgi:hypothetical protein
MLNYFLPGGTFDLIEPAKTTASEATTAAQQAMCGQPCILSQIQEREADLMALAEVSHALDEKASAT